MERIQPIPRSNPVGDQLSGSLEKSSRNSSDPCIFEFQRQARTLALPFTYHQRMVTTLLDDA